MYSLSGALNVALLLTTRPNLLLFRSNFGRQNDYEISVPSVPEPKAVTETQSSGTVGRLQDDEGMPDWDIPSEEGAPDTADTTEVSRPPMQPST